jgi:hypothetical protein
VAGMGEEELNEEAVRFKLEELRRLRDQIDQRINHLESLSHGSEKIGRAPPAKIIVRQQSTVTTDSTASDVVGMLEELPWKRAKSKKCYWVRGEEAPWGVRDALRRNLNELMVGAYRYVILDNDNILRFERNKV